MPPVHRRLSGSTVRTLVFGGCLAATALSSLVVGLMYPWLQLFGEATDRGDYLAAGGAYGTGALLLGVGAFGAHRTGLGPSWTGFAAGTAAFLLLASAMSLARAGAAGPATGSMGGWWDGGLAVALLPWAWPPVLAAGWPRAWWPRR